MLADIGSPQSAGVTKIMLASLTGVYRFFRSFSKVLGIHHLEENKNISIKATIDKYSDIPNVMLKGIIYFIKLARNAGAHRARTKFVSFDKIRKYYTRPSQFNWGPENVHFGK